MPWTYPRLSVAGLRTTPAPRVTTCEHTGRQAQGVGRGREREDFVRITHSGAFSTWSKQQQLLEKEPHVRMLFFVDLVLILIIG